MMNCIEQDSDEWQCMCNELSYCTWLYLLTHCHGNYTKIKFYSLKKVSAAKLHHQAKHHCPVHPPAASPCLQVVIMNRDQAERGG